MNTTETNAPAVLEPSVELFQFFFRDELGDTYLNELPFAWLELYRNNPQTFPSWEVRKQIGDRWVVIAQSDNWHETGAVVHFMREMRKTSYVFQGLRVETNGDCIYVYFTDTAHPFDSCIKIYNRHSISIVGNVTLENYDGFLHAAHVAKHLLK